MIYNEASVRDYIARNPEEFGFPRPLSSHIEVAVENGIIDIVLEYTDHIVGIELNLGKLDKNHFSKILIYRQDLLRGTVKNKVIAKSFDGKRVECYLGSQGITESFVRALKELPIKFFEFDIDDIVKKERILNGSDSGLGNKKEPEPEDPTPPPSPETIFLVKPFVHETAESIIEQLHKDADLIGIKPPFKIVHSIKKNIPKGSIIVCDLLLRLGDKLEEIVKIISRLEEESVHVVVPGCIDLRPPARENQDVALFLKLIHSVGKDRRSQKIKEALFIRKMRGHKLGREPVNDDTKKLVLAEFSRTNSIRATARNLKKSGNLGTSRSSVARIIHSEHDPLTE
jgi:hypothetical protein